MTGIRLNAIPTTAVPTVEHLVPAESPDGITHVLRVQQFIDLAKAQIVGNASAEYDTLLEIQTLLENDDTAFAALSALVNTKANSADVYTQAQVDAAILASHNVTHHRVTSVNSAWIVGENFYGDTGVSLASIDLYITRVQNVAIVRGHLRINGFSKTFPNDGFFSFYFDVGTIASAVGAFDEILEGGYFAWTGEWAGTGLDSPWVTVYGSVQKNTSSYPNMLYFRTGDSSNHPTSQTVTELETTFDVVLIVGDN